MNFAVVTRNTLSPFVGGMTDVIITRFSGFAKVVANLRISRDKECEMEPTFWLDPEYPDHFRWQHDCQETRKLWEGKASQETVERFATSAHLLPIGSSFWTIVQEEPLTVTPSILCKECGLHGFITDGKWVPA